MLVKFLDGTEKEFDTLRGANLQRADLWGADLWGANLQGANLQRADLREADLWGATFAPGWVTSKDCNATKKGE